MSLGSRWRPPLRVARREALRAKGRSVLVLAMIALPVLGVTAADVVIQTAEVSGAEALERRLGTADARITVHPRVTQVAQTADPERDGSSWSQGKGRERAPTLVDVAGVLGSDVEAVEVVVGSALVTTDAGVADVEVTETDLTSRLLEGTYRITEGRTPAVAGEVAINADLAARGFQVGDELEVHDGPTLDVVGIAEDALSRGHPKALALPDTFGLRAVDGQHTWLVDAAGPVTWDDVRALNDIGAEVLSRAVLEDPPADSEVAPELRSWATGNDGDVIAVAVLVVVMALLEVVLLAGPAFAVIARRLQRSLALMGATGATPRQARRVVLACGLVLGAAGATIGVGLGLLVAWLGLPVVQRFSDSYLGPYDVPWLHLIGIAGFGLLSALLAAVVPAWIASRQNVVAVLAGRRGDRRPSLRSPLLGLLLLGAGIALSVYGARRPSMGEYLIATASVVAVLGMILLVPVAVAVLARLARGMPLPLRYAVRDAARHRARTVPAVSAVAATVCGVVALGIANASDAAQSEAMYEPTLAAGHASLSSYGGRADWESYQDVVERFVPDADISRLVGIPDNAGRRAAQVQLRIDGQRRILRMYGSTLGTSIPVSEDGAVPSSVTGLSAAERARGEQALAAGGAIVFTDRALTADEVTVIAVAGGRRSTVTVPAAVVRVSGSGSGFRGVLSQQAASSVDVDPATVGLIVSGADITAGQEQNVQEALNALSPSVNFYVERGYESGDEALIVLLVLGALGGVLMLGGTLTATFLSLSDARPDLATLAAVGASPRTRRAVAASYALVIGLVGAVLGAAVGFIPGVAATYPLTGERWQGVDPSLPDHFLAVPWLLIGSIVVALPLVTALAVGLTTRSRLPMVSRID